MKGSEFYPGLCLAYKDVNQYFFVIKVSKFYLRYIYDVERSADVSLLNSRSEIQHIVIIHDFEYDKWSIV